MEATLNEYKDAVKAQRMETKSMKGVKQRLTNKGRCKSSSRRLYRCIFTGFDI